MVKIDFDGVITHIGGSGLYQYYLLTLTIIVSDVINPWNAFGLAFITFTPDFHCNVTQPSNYNRSRNVSEVIPTIGSDSSLPRRFQVSNNKTTDSVNGYTEYYRAINNSTTPPKFQCDIPSAENVNNHIANNNGSGPGIREITLRCMTGYIYDTSLLESTLVTDFDLVCDMAIYVPLVRNILFASSVIGLMLISYLQDRVGRKPSFQFCMGLMCAGSFATGFAPTLNWFIAGRAICDFCAYSTFNTGYVWAMEMASPGKRTLTSSLFCGCYSIGASMLPGVAYLLGTWRGLVLFVGIATIIPFAVFPWITYESPRWLHASGNSKESFAILRKMIQFDRRLRTFFRKKKQYDQESEATDGRGSDLSIELTERSDTPLAVSDESNTKPRPSPVLSSDEKLLILNKLEIEENEDPKLENNENTKSKSIFSLLASPNLRLKTIVVFVCLILNNVSYNSMAFAVEKIGGNFMISFALQAAVEAPAIWLNNMILNRFGRIIPVAGFMLLSGSCMLATVIADLLSLQWLVVTLAIAGKFFICMSFAIILQLCVEIFPTELRARALAFGTFLGAAFNMVIPFIIHSSHFYFLTPLIFIGIFSVVAACLSLLLPETKNCALPETVEDAERSGILGIPTAVSHIRRASKFG